MDHNPEKGSLATLFKLKCDNAVKTEYLKLQYQKHSHNGHVELEPYKHHDTQEDIDALMDIDALFEGQFGQILKMRSEGYTQAEIADIVGVTQSYVSKVINKVRKEYYADN